MTDVAASKLHELLRQPYANCTLSAGTVEDHPHDTCYIKFEREGEGETLILLRPDEMAAVAWLASGVLWSILEAEARDG